MALSAGAPADSTWMSLPLSEAEVRARPLVNVGDRIRSYFMRPPLAPGSSPPQKDRPPEEKGARGGPPVGWFSIMEFVPVSPTLVARARRTLLVALAGAGILTLATLLFWRTSIRYDDARRRLEEQRRLTVLGEMSAVLAHEIRNPLASLKGHAQLLGERLPDESADKRRADRVVDEARRLEVLTNDLLEFARAGPMALERVSPARILDTTARDLPVGSVVVDTTRAPQSWRLDERRFSHAVLANLLRNAVQASPPDHPAEAATFAENGSLVFTVRDHGAGLPAGQEARLFDPFFTTRTTGTGLGLALARRVVELHGGHISASNAPGGGALFRVELPDRPG
jgi:two-component system sensor histidine kinase HydH